MIWFFTLGLLGIGWFIDLFLIPGMDRKAALKFRSGRYDYSVAWILLTFLGLLGIHRFYLGKPVTGLIWLLTAFVSRISSLSALVSALFAPLLLWQLTRSTELTATLALMTLLLYWRHRSNVSNIIAGTEHRIGVKKDGTD